MLLSRILAMVLSLALFGGAPLDALAQSAHHKRKKSHKPKPVPCRTGCAPATPSAEIAPGTPEEEAAQRELSELARALHNAAPGSYERLSAFAAKNAANIWGARAALALGYDDYNKNHGQQALAWFTKAKGDTLLADYVLYWTGQTLRLLKRNAEAFSDLQGVERDYPNTALKEQFLEALAPVAVETGHPQAAIDALEAYSRNLGQARAAARARPGLQGGASICPRGQGLPGAVLQESAFGRGQGGGHGALAAQERSRLRVS